jgi:hypothetical protein
LLFGLITDKSLVAHPEGARKKNKYETMEIDPNGDIPEKDIVDMLLRQMKLYDGRV